MIKFSIITTSIQNYKNIEPFFRSLSNQTYRNFELIFVDQSNLTRKKIIENYKIKNLVYIKIKKSCLSNARNIGLKYSKGDYLLFIDDDCYFKNLFLYNLNLKLKKNMYLLGFQIKYKNENIIVKKFNKKILNNKLEIIRYLCSSNFVIKRNNISFCELLGVGSKTLAQSGEDTDYLIKNFKNKNFFFEKSLNIYHPKPQEKNNQKKVFLYSVGQSVMLFKNKLYFIFFISIIKNFLTIFSNFNYSKFIYFIGKLFGLIYFFIFWNKKS